MSAAKQFLLLGYFFGYYAGFGVGAKDIVNGRVLDFAVAR